MKHYGWGVIDNKGVSSDSWKYEWAAEEGRKELNDLFPEDCPHRVVEIFFKELE